MCYMINELKTFIKDLPGLVSETIVFVDPWTFVTERWTQEKSSGGDMS